MVELGLIGYPLGHSFSKQYFTDKFEKLNIEGEYNLFPLTNINELMSLLKEQPQLSGFNVTIPYKQQILKYIDKKSDDVKDIGATNTVKIHRGDSGILLAAYNTDWKAFSDSLTALMQIHNIKAPLRNAIILGTGGASKAVCYALRKTGCNVLFVSRNANQKRSDVLKYSELDEAIIKKADVIINTTPLGMWPDVKSCPDIPYNFISKDTICYDLVYNPDETEFMRMCKKHRAIVKNGLEMLHRQADLAYNIFLS